MPKRIQRKRTKGWRMPPGAVYVGRPSRWGNPYRVGMVGVSTNSVAVHLFERLMQRADLHQNDRWFMFTPERIRADLRGKDLVCWCALDEPCHADVLLRLANE